MERQLAEHLSRDLEQHGIENPGTVLWDADAPVLYEEFVRRREGLLAPGGGLAVKTGRCTGRSPNDKFIVREAPSEAAVWWGKVNRPWTPKGYTHRGRYGCLPS